MGRRFTAREIGEIAEFTRYQRHRNGAKPEDILQFEYQKGDRLAVLEKVRFGRSSSGRPTTKMIECVEDGTERCYGKYDFEVTAFMISGVRIKTF